MFPLPGYSQDRSGNEKEMIKIIEGSVKSFLNEIPEDVLPNYGIRNPLEIINASLGEPVGVYMPVNGKQVFTDSWRVPLVIDKEYRALFTVVFDKAEGYKIVDFGATVLAGELFKISKATPISGMLRVYEIRRDFFMSIATEGNVKYMPVPNPDQKVYSFDEVIQLIK
jgi:hypothetical protein